MRCAVIGCERWVVLNAMQELRPTDMPCAPVHTPTSPRPLPSPNTIKNQGTDWPVRLGRLDSSEAGPGGRIPADDAPVSEIVGFMKQLGAKPGGGCVGCSRESHCMSTWLLWPSRTNNGRLPRPPAMSPQPPLLVF